MTSRAGRDSALPGNVGGGWLIDGVGHGGGRAGYGCRGTGDGGRGIGNLGLRINLAGDHLGGAVGEFGSRADHRPSHVADDGDPVGNVGAREHDCPTAGGDAVGEAQAHDRTRRRGRRSDEVAGEHARDLRRVSLAGVDELPADAALVVDRGER
ncbi:hypothetical protein [Brevibacterium sp. W7.2]|uniref:hypothetical protein n=1 Tax=Brevibacterium sp. W7.2 TaxID=2823518 RepID=UPI001BA6B3CC|nr:hypothetical protein [Brevibacterium sp. W7.2]